MWIVTDAELVERLKSYDDDAYREAIARYGDALYRYVYSLTGDHHLARAIVGETYLKMLEAIEGYSYSGDPFKAWLYRIAHNHAVNALKRANRMVAVEDLERVAQPITDPAIRVVEQLAA
ncbi:MAG: hypothetical protein RLZZ387_136, partial [Chloroflexota bacterium]